MVQGMVWMTFTCMVFILSSLWEPTTAHELKDEKTWISLLLTNEDIKENRIKITQNSQKIIQDTNTDEMNNDVPVYEDDETGRLKRVFLSRGWGPGGYEAPSPPPQRFVRRPLQVRQSPQTKNKEKFFHTPTGINGGAQFAALVSPRQRELKTLQKPQYRRFHSIFTSGTWSPLGKRSNIKAHHAQHIKGSLEKNEVHREKIPLRFTFDDDILISDKNKRSGVFTSNGWGAGGSSPPFKHPWMQPSESLRSHIYPRVISMTNGDTSSGGDWHMANFRSGGISQEEKPLFHLFVSHGWGPMGR